MSLMTLLFFTSVAHANDCESSSSNMAEIRACIESDSSAELDQAYLSLVSQLKLKKPNAVAALVKSQKSWEVFATDSCEYYAKLHSGQMIEADSRLNCWSDFRAARVKVLQSWQKSLLSAK